MGGQAAVLYAVHVCAGVTVGDLERVSESTDRPTVGIDSKATTVDLGWKLSVINFDLKFFKTTEPSSVLLKWVDEGSVLYLKGKRKSKQSIDEGLQK